MFDLSQAIVSAIGASGANDPFLLCGCTTLMFRTRHAVATSRIAILVGVFIAGGSPCRSGKNSMIVAAYITKVGNFLAADCHRNILQAQGDVVCRIHPLAGFGVQLLTGIWRRNFKFGVPYGNRSVAAVKEKRFTGIQRKPAAWIARQGS